MRNFRNVFCFSIFCLLTLAFARLSFGVDLIDNLVVASGKSYNVKDDLVVGALVYIDRHYKYSSVPEQLEGATYIKTANDDKGSSGDSFMSFDINQDVTVYVAHDDRIISKPIWLQSFVDIDEDIVTTDTVFSLFAKDSPAGIIILGGNNGDSRKSMYMVIVVKEGIDNISPASPIGVKVIELWIRYK